MPARGKHFAFDGGKRRAVRRLPTLGHGTAHGMAASFGSAYFSDAVVTSPRSRLIESDGGRSHEELVARQHLVPGGCVESCFRTLLIAAGAGTLLPRRRLQRTAAGPVRPCRCR